MKILFFCGFICFFICRAQKAIPEVQFGNIERLDHFSSKYITSRPIDIWLPENYSKAKKYSVLYMHDGQMLFDKNITWNHTAWDVDDVTSELIKKTLIDEIIVIGIWNVGQDRHSDYFPEKPYTYIGEDSKQEISKNLKESGIITSQKFQPKSDNYLKFIVEELKPFVDRNYSVKTDVGNTFIGGSSMGALISWYAVCEYPKVFGGAICMSTHWIGTILNTENPIPNAFLKYLDLYLPSPGTQKFYFDCGDQTLDRFYPQIQKKVDALMKNKGFSEYQWMTKYFKDENHSEIAWSKRLHIPITFLFKSN